MVLASVRFVGDTFRTSTNERSVLRSIDVAPASDDLYQILRADQTNRTMLILEATIVLLFIADLVVLIMGLG